MTNSHKSARIGSYTIIEPVVPEASHPVDRVLFLVKDDDDQLYLLERCSCGNVETAVSHYTPLQQDPANQIVEIFSEANHLHFVYTGSNGRMLSDLLAENPAAFTTEESLKLCRQLVENLAASANYDIFQADVHPENIWVLEDKTAVLLGWCIDEFNTTRTIPNNQQSYAAPESKTGAGPTPQTAIYSLGVLLFTLLAHHPPRFDTKWDVFSPDERTRVILLEDSRSGLSAVTYQLVRACLWRQLWARYQTFTDLLAAIDLAIVEESTQHSEPKRKYFALPNIQASKINIFVYGFVGISLIGLVLSLLQGVFGEKSEGAVETAVPAIFEELATLTATHSITMVPTEPAVMDATKHSTGTAEANTKMPQSSSTPTSMKTTAPEHEPTATPTKEATVTSEATSTSSPTSLPTATEVEACVPIQPVGWIVYTIKPDNYLFNLASVTGTTVANIQAVNCLATDEITIGQTVFLPNQPVVNTPSPDATEDSGSSNAGQPGSAQPTKRPRATKTPPPPP